MAKAAMQAVIDTLGWHFSTVSSNGRKVLKSLNSSFVDHEHVAGHAAHEAEDSTGDTHQCDKYQYGKDWKQGADQQEEHMAWRLQVEEHRWATLLARHHSSGRAEVEEELLQSQQRVLLLEADLQRAHKTIADVFALKERLLEQHALEAAAGMEREQQLTYQAQALLAERQALTSQVARLTSMLQAAEQEVEFLRARCSEQTEQLEASQHLLLLHGEELQAADEKLAALEQLAESQATRLLDMQKCLAAAEEENRIQSEQLEAAAEQLKVASEQLEAAAEREDGLVGAAAELQARCDSLNASLAGHATDLAATQGRLQLAQEELESLDRHADTLQGDLESRGRLVAALARQLQEHDTTLCRLANAERASKDRAQQLLFWLERAALAASGARVQLGWARKDLGELPAVGLPEALAAALEQLTGRLAEATEQLPREWGRGLVLAQQLVAAPLVPGRA